MPERLVASCADKRKILQGTLLAVCCIAIITRLYLYWYPKDLWLDEGSIFWALYQGSWENVLHCRLAFTQCCPIFFALYNKLLFSFSCTQHALYFLPTCTGIALIILFAALAQRIDGKLYAVLCVVLFCSLKIFVYYSSELKQYIFEAFMTSFVIYIYIYDLLTYGEKRFLSWKYPLLMSASLLISSPSVVISAGLATTTALYLKIEKKYSLQSIFSVFLRRYALFGLVCLVYYFTYLKNGNSPGMQDWWKEYFFPTSLSAWPEYIRTVYFGGKSFPDFSVWLYVKFIATVLGFLLLACGSCFLWRKNRFILLALLTPFGFAAIAAFFFYPLLLGASVWSRLSLYLVPLQILLVGQALLPLMDAVLARISRTMLLLGACSLIAAVLCINVVFAVRGMGHEQISPLISSCKIVDIKKSFGF